jgi:hypothetical protein
MARYIRVYRCPDCGHKWRSESKFGFHEPDCPSCGFHPDPLPERIAAPAIIGTKAKAVDLAYNIASEDYGLTDLNDNAREGDIAFKPPAAPPQNIIMPGNRVQNSGGFMWGGAQTGQVVQAPLPPAAAIKGAAAIANAEGRNPLRMLHQARPTLNQYSLGRFDRR